MFKYFGWVRNLFALNHRDDDLLDSSSEQLSESDEIEAALRSQKTPATEDELGLIGGERSEPIALDGVDELE